MLVLVSLEFKLSFSLNFRNGLRQIVKVSSLIKLNRFRDLCIVYAHFKGSLLYVAHLTCLWLQKAAFTNILKDPSRSPIANFSYALEFLKCCLGIGNNFSDRFVIGQEFNALLPYQKALAGTANRHSPSASSSIYVFLLCLLPYRS